MNTILKLATLVAWFGFAASAQAVEENYISNGAGLGGYDPVAYHTAGEAIEGSESITADAGGVTYRFSSEANRDAFLADPVKYEPAYGGYCAFGAAHGVKAPGDPTLWKIVDGTLYVNLNKNIQERWNKNVSGFLKSSDNNWPIIRELSSAKLRSGDTIEGVIIGAQ